MIKSRPAAKAGEARTFTSNQQTDVDATLDTVIAISATSVARKFVYVIGGVNPGIVTPILPYMKTRDQSWVVVTSITSISTASQDT